MRDEDFFYEGAERGDLLDALNGHAHEGDTTVLEGEPGSGVSTLLGMLSMSLVGDFELIRLDGADGLGANAVVDAMLAHFGIERADLADTLKQTLAHNRLVIVVDNAERLPEAAVGTMASLKQKLGQRLAYVFGAEIGASDKLRAAGLEVADVLELPPLDDGEIIAFADEALGLALDDEDAAELQQRSDGRIGPLLRLLEERNQAAGGAAASARRPIPWRHGLAVGALVVVVLALWLASGGDDEAPADKVTGLKLPAPPARIEEPKSEQPQRPGLLNSAEHSREALAGYADSAKAFERADRRREPEKPKPDEQASAPVTQAPVDAEPAPAAKPEAEPSKSTASESAAPKPATDGEKPAPKATKPAPTGLDADLAYREDDWLATRADSEWFLQITATGREDGARGVLDQLDHEGAYYRTERGDKPAYLVLAGPYASREAALAAREKLPEALRKTGPFPRSMGDIRKELP